MVLEREKPEITENLALGGRLRLRQPQRGHRFGHDAVLLAAATQASPGDHVVEFGAGVGLAGLAVAQRVPGARVTLVDVDPGLVVLAADNAAENGLADRVRALALDVTSSARRFAEAGLSPGEAQAVMMNPPFNDPHRLNPSPDTDRAAAHAAGPELLAAWCRAATRLLAASGRLSLIWRADGLGDVLGALSGGFGALAVIPVHPRERAAAVRILVGGIKGSRAPLALKPGLVLTGPDRQPTPQAEAILRHGATLALWDERGSTAARA